jgi:DNA processing protein
MTIITKDDDIYPGKLLEIKDPPKKLYLMGRKELLDKRSVAIVGSRKCSEYGKIVAMKIAGEAAMNGFCVISGMALGIDNFAHRGALKVGGDTIAVLGTGIDICYPRQHRDLYEKIAYEGLLVSEQEPGTGPQKYTFPLRNRIIAGLSEAVIVVEARADSGSLITAELGMDQNKHVFAVPGNITSMFSLGTNRLISEGAQIVSVIDDIFCELGVAPKLREEDLSELGKDERTVFGMVKENGEMSIDMLCFRTGKDFVTVNTIVSALEMKGFVDYRMGKVMAVKL